MPSRITSGGVLLPPSKVRSESPCTAELIRSLAGRAAELYEYALGEPVLDGHPPVTASNPQGLTGWDWSGPPWGSAVLHPVAWLSGRSPDAAAFLAPDITDQTERLFGRSSPAIIRFPIYVRPFDKLPEPSVAPYGKLAVAIRTHRVSGATTPTATVRVYNPTAGVPREQAVTGNFATTATETTQTFANALRVPTVGGTVNAIVLEIVVDGTTDASQHYVDSAILATVVKRSH